MKPVLVGIEVEAEASQPVENFLPLMLHQVYQCPFFTFGEIMDDYFLNFMCLIPMFFGAWAVRSIIDDIKRGKQ